MKSMIQIGGNLPRKTVRNLGEFVETVFKSARKNGMEPDVIITALKLVKGISRSDHAVITNSTFTG